LKYPSSTASFSPRADLFVEAMLRSIPEIRRRPENLKAYRQEEYFESEQYENRPYNWDGSMVMPGDDFGARIYPSERIAPMDLRKPLATYPAARIIVERISALLLGEDRHPVIRCAGDPVSEEFCRGIAEASLLWPVAKTARNLGGTHGSVFLSYGWVNGKPVVEAHRKTECEVLEWADSAHTQPLHVVKAWCVPENTIREGKLACEPVWYAREWRGTKQIENAVIPGYQKLWRFDAQAMNGAGLWALKNEIASEECGVVYVINSPMLGDKPRCDFENCQGLIDQYIMVMNSTTGGTVRNADPTLAVDIPPEANDGEEIRKGGHNVIFGKASYVEISGTSVDAGLKNADRLRVNLFEAACVSMLDPDKLSGVQSGEAMRRLMFPMTENCDGLRSQYGQFGIAKVIDGLLNSAIRIANENKPKQTSTSTNKTPSEGKVFDLPPRVIKEMSDGKEVVKEVIDRDDPGTGGHIYLEWPPYVKDTAHDELQRVQTIQAANGGFPIISPKRAIELAAPFSGVTDAEEEVSQILDGAEQLSEVRLGAMDVGRPAQQSRKGSPPDKTEGDEGASGGT
jgi:hypothetical protein